MPKTINISADDLKEIKELPPNTVLININNTNGELFPLQVNRDSAKVLSLRFDDVTASRTNQIDKITLNPINAEQALKILNFININKSKDIIVNCHAGVSRSSAICLYLHIMEGYELKDNFWNISAPNPFVLGALMIMRKKK